MEPIGRNQPKKNELIDKKEGGEPVEGEKEYYQTIPIHLDLKGMGHVDPKIKNDEENPKKN